MTTGPILLFGAAGLVGHRLRSTLADVGPVLPITRAEIDLTDAEAIRRLIRSVAPRLVVNSAAYTQTDKAESEPELCAQVNAIAPEVMAVETARIGSPFVHFSTDYVFDGRSTVPYVESDVPAPLNVYGRTKLEGERAVLAVGGMGYVFRIGSVFDHRGRNFLTTIRRLVEQKDELRVVADQTCVPTWAALVAAATSDISRAILADATIASDHAGLYHMAGTGRGSWADLARESLRLMPVTGRERVAVVPIDSAEYPTAACRPRFSVLDSSKLASEFGIALPDWREQLRLCHAEGN